MNDNKNFETGVIVRRGKAFIQTFANIKNSGTVIVAPIHVVNLEVGAIAESLARVFSAGNPILPSMTPEEFKNLPDPTLEAANVASWKHLRKNAANYMLCWNTEKNTISFSASDPNARIFQGDRSRKRLFQIQTEMRTLAQAILDDVSTRPDVINPPPETEPPYRKPNKIKKIGTGKPTPTLTDMMAAYAKEAVELGQRGFKVNLDYSEESLKQVEAILDRYHKDLPKNKKDRPPEDRIWTIANGWAGYIGEVIKKKWGGAWVHESYSPPGATIILKVGSFDIFLPAKVYKRLVNGSEDNTWHLYQVLKAQFEAAGMTSK